MTPYQQQMDNQFNAKTWDNTSQSSTRTSYQSLYYTIDALPSGPEQSVAKRKLLESLDAALRCHAN